MPTRYWLMKCEPSAYTIDALAKDGRTGWEGVRNYQARNHMRAMKKGDLKTAHTAPAREFATAFETGTMSAKELLARYCGMLYDRLGTIEDVARRTGLDRRTAKKYIDTMHANR